MRESVRREHARGHQTCFGVRSRWHIINTPQPWRLAVLLLADSVPAGTTARGQGPFTVSSEGAPSRWMAGRESRHAQRCPLKGVVTSETTTQEPVSVCLCWDVGSQETELCVPGAGTGLDSAQL